MQKTLNIRSLVIDVAEETDYYIKFSNICRKSGNSQLCLRILSTLKQALPSHKPAEIAKVNYEILKYQYGQGEFE